MISARWGRSAADNPDYILKFDEKNEKNVEKVHKICLDTSLERAYSQAILFAKAGTFTNLRKAGITIVQL